MLLPNEENTCESNRRRDRVTTSVDAPSKTVPSGECKVDNNGSGPLGQGRKEGGAGRGPHDVDVDAQVGLREPLEETDIDSSSRIAPALGSNSRRETDALIPDVCSSESESVSGGASSDGFVSSQEEEEEKEEEVEKKITLDSDAHKGGNTSCARHVDQEVRACQEREHEGQRRTGTGAPRKDHPVGIGSIYTNTGEEGYCGCRAANLALNFAEQAQPSRGEKDLCVTSKKVNVPDVADGVPAVGADASFRLTPPMRSAGDMCGSPSEPSAISTAEAPSGENSCEGMKEGRDTARVAVLKTFHTKVLRRLFSRRGTCGIRTTSSQHSGSTSNPTTMTSGKHECFSATGAVKAVLTPPSHTKLPKQATILQPPHGQSILYQKLFMKR